MGEWANGRMNHRRRSCGSLAGCVSDSLDDCVEVDRDIPPHRPMSRARLRTIRRGTNLGPV